MMWCLRLLATSVALLTVSARAFGYCRTTTCDREDHPAACEQVPPCTYSSIAQPIAWPDTCVSTSVSAFGSSQGISADDLRSVVMDAFGKWTSAPCVGGGVPSFVVDAFPDVNCTKATGDFGYKTQGPNYNIWIFRDDQWVYDSIGEYAIAITTTQFNPTTGEIYDSDVELNSLDNVFTLGDIDVEIDLPSVVLHEAGHFLGLAHASVPSAVMTPTLNSGDASRRVLRSDDIDGICAIYPPQRAINPACDPEPRHGFSTECTQPEPSCAVARMHGRASSQNWIAALTGLAVLCCVRRRRMEERRLRAG